MSVVVEAIEGVVDFAGDVVESVLDDPLTAIATAAAFSYGIPFLGLKAGALAAGVANTAAGLVQGEEFDEAVKGGVMAGAASWVGGKIAGGFGDDVAAVSDDAATAAAKSTVASSGDEAASALASSGDEIGTTIASSGDEIVTAGLGDDVVGAGLSDDALKEIVDPDNLMRAQSFMERNPTAYAQNINTVPGQVVDDSFGVGTGLRNAAGDVIEGAGTVSNPILKSDILTKGTNLSGSTGTKAASFIDEAAGVTPKSPLEVYNQITQQPEKGWDYLTASKGEWDKIAKAVSDTGGEYLDEAIDFAKTYPNTTALGVVGTGAAVKSLMDKKDEEEERLTEEQRRMQEQMAEADKTYYDPLVQYTLRRQVYTPYTEEELSRYGEDKGGEGRFFSNSIYDPYTPDEERYQQGGAVMPQAPSKMNPAFAFYKYGNVPNSVRRYEGGGYAEGGSRGDGRSDHIEALLSPGEFVMDAETVSLLGNGSSEAGARRLEEMRQAVRKQKGGALSKGKFSPDAKSPLAYLSKKR